MKNKNFHFLITLLLTAVVCTSVASESALDNQILKIKPQADLNGDGKLSDAEKAAMKKMIIKRFPRSDSDRDGDLSEKELGVVVRIATVRAKKQGSHGQGKKTNQGKERRTPTHANVKYGKDERNVFDIWLAKSDKPTPLAIYIHGGGFRAGSKEKLSNDILSQLLKAGISVASINYRYLSIDTPLPTSHHDARRALQFMRSKAEESATRDFAFLSYGPENTAAQSARYRYIRYEDSSEELYDHKKDPHEWTNLIGNKKYQKLTKKMRAQVLAFQKK